MGDWQIWNRYSSSCWVLLEDFSINLTEASRIWLWKRWLQKQMRASDVLLTRNWTNLNYSCRHGRFWLFVEELDFLNLMKCQIHLNQFHESQRSSFMRIIQSVHGLLSKYWSFLEKEFHFGCNMLLFRKKEERNLWLGTFLRTDAAKMKEFRPSLFSFLGMEPAPKKKDRSDQCQRLLARFTEMPWLNKNKCNQNKKKRVKIK